MQQLAGPDCVLPAGTEHDCCGRLLNIRLAVRHLEALFCIRPFRSGELTVWSASMTIVQHMPAGSRRAYRSVRRVPTSTIQVAAVKEDAFQTILHHSWLTLLHDLDGNSSRVGLQPLTAHASMVRSASNEHQSTRAECICCSKEHQTKAMIHQQRRPT